jgi:alpha-N-acetylglucosaminidase
VCKKVITDCELEEYVTSQYQDLLKMKTKIKYDYILFSESYPVISKDIMKAMMGKCKKLLKPSGKVCFIHNLEENKEPIREFIKPKLIYVTSVDFGRLTTHREFDEFVEDVEYKLVRKELIEKVNLSKLYSIPLLRPIDDFLTCHQYYMEVIPM